MKERRNTTLVADWTLLWLQIEHYFGNKWNTTLVADWTLLW